MITILSIILVTAIIQSMFSPWWNIAIVAFAVSFFRCRTPANAFISGFSAISVLWLSLVLYRHSYSGILHHLPYPWVLLIATPLLGGIIAGFAAISGHYLRMAYKPFRAKEKQK